MAFENFYFQYLRNSFSKEKFNPIFVAPTLHPGYQDLIDENALTKFQLFLPNDLSKDSRRFTHARMMEIRYFNKCTKH